MDIVTLLFTLVVVHCLFDFALQTEAIAINKNPDAGTPLQAHVPWYYWMGSHALLHGGGVALVTGSVVLGMLETAAHFSIDWGKCKGYFTIHQDQFLHFLCKVIWTGLILLAR